MDMQPHVQVLVGGLTWALGLSSLAVWVAIARTLRKYGTILPYEPRRPVPWGPAGLVIAILFVSDKIAGIISPAELPDVAAAEAAVKLLQMSALWIVITALGFVLLVGVSRAHRHDLGLPDAIGDALADIALGIVALLAALGPVYAMLQVFFIVFGPIPQNPLLEKLLENPTPRLMAAAAVSAVIAAPIFEEFVFRLLLQGWLEKILKRHARSRIDPGLPGEMGPEDTSTRTQWMPIVISSVLFAAAHLGYGYSPAPLFLLAMILGYVYQRTHRILPCIVVHMVFNGISVLIVWIEIVGRE